MGKRSNFDRKPRDFYETPAAAVLPLLPHLQPHTDFIEVCAGEGKLIDHLEAYGHFCVGAFDLHSNDSRVELKDARELNFIWGEADCIITNPPWQRDLLHELIEHLSVQLPTWLLLDADWVHTRQAKPYLSSLRKVVSVGRVKWFAETKKTGFDNCAWHLFSQPMPLHTIFVGREV